MLIYFLNQWELETRPQTVHWIVTASPQPTPQHHLLSPCRSLGFLPPHRPFFPPPCTYWCAGVSFSPNDGPVRGPYHQWERHSLPPSQLFSDCDWQRTTRQWILWGAVLCHYQLFISFYSSTSQVKQAEALSNS